MILAYFIKECDNCKKKNQLHTMFSDFKCLPLCILLKFSYTNVSIIFNRYEIIKADGDWMLNICSFMVDSEISIPVVFDTCDRMMKTILKRSSCTTQGVQPCLYFSIKFHNKKIKSEVIDE